MISTFEYVTVLISIILGMGITQLISGIAGIILRWERVKIYWPHLVLILLVFIIHIQDWWATYELRTYQYWRLPTFLFIILYPVNLYILTRILFPVRWSGSALDLKGFFFKNYKKIYLCMMLLPLHALVDNIFIGGYALHDQLLQVVIFILLGLVVSLNRTDEWIHKSIATLFLAITILAFVIEWNIFLIANTVNKF